MKKLWLAVSLSFLLNLAVAVRLVQDEGLARRVTERVVEMILQVNFKVDALTQ